MRVYLRFAFTGLSSIVVADVLLLCWAAAARGPVLVRTQARRTAMKVDNWKMKVTNWKNESH